MWSKLIGYMILFQDFIAVSVPVCLALFIAVWILTGKFTWNGKRRVLYGWFYNRSDRELLFVSAAFLQFLFILSCALMGTQVEPVHLVFLVVLAVVKLIAGLMIPVFLRDLLNSLLIFCAFLVGNILSGYLRETRMNLFVIAVLILLGIFLVLYGAYFLLRDINATERDMGI